MSCDFQISGDCEEADISEAALTALSNWLGDGKYVFAMEKGNTGRFMVSLHHVYDDPHPVEASGLTLEAAIMAALKYKTAYTQKDLGYPRQKTDAKLRVEMPDGSLWDVPVQIIADDRDKHYAYQKEDTVALCRETGTDELMYWAALMHWAHVEDFAVQQRPARPPDFQKGWVNGTKRIVGPM